MTKFVANGFGFISLDDSCKLFPDIREKHTFYSYATTLKCKGIVSGYPDGKFGPDDPLTRGQAMKFVVVGSRVAKGNEDFLPLLQNNVFPDVPQTHTFYENIHAAYSHSIVNGYPNGEFGPDDQITRGQMAKMISNGRAKINEDLGL